MLVFASLSVLAFALGSENGSSSTTIPPSFGYLSKIDEAIIQSVRYATTENFVGTVVRGYEAKRIICKLAVAEALAEVQRRLKPQGYSLVVYDAYRPRRAVEHFVEWSESGEMSTKARYYPTYDNPRVLFDLGFIARRSVHSQGYAVDVTLIRVGESLRRNIVVRDVKLANGEVVPWLDDGTIDMGTGFDLFHNCSWAESDLVSKEAQANRKLLRDTMIGVGFQPIRTEWWHFNFPPEAYDFVIR
jgi:D-alanyl-D-alanine dipeptidase